MRHLEIGRQRGLVHGEAVVLRGDLHLARGEIHHRLVGAAVAKRELEGLGPAGEGEQLVAEADAKHRHLPDESFDGFDTVAEHLGIAGAVGEKHAVGLVGEHLGGGRAAGQHGHVAAHAREVAGDVPLHAVIEGDHLLLSCPGCDRSRVAPFERLRHGLRPFVERFRPRGGPFGHHFANEVAADEGWRGLGLGDECRGVEHFAGEHARHRAADPQVPDERPGVDAGEAHDAGLGEVIAEGAFGGEVAGEATGLADDEAGHLELAAFDVGVVDAVVADLWRGHAEDLTAVGGIGEDLLVAGHRGVEAHLARHGAGGAERLADVDGAVFECECCACHDVGPSVWMAPAGLSRAVRMIPARRGAAAAIIFAAESLGILGHRQGLRPSVRCRVRESRRLPGRAAFAPVAQLDRAELS